KPKTKNPVASTLLIGVPRSEEYYPFYLIKMVYFWTELLVYFSAEISIIVHKVYMESCCYKEYTEIEEENIKNIHIPKVKRKGNTLEKYSSRCIEITETQKSILTEKLSNT
ncbi:MAG: hypothetical protein Q8T08_25190, partial [Ignavibacteria bacterium]|nr:hypothetical protein [Ignavibacteria bacterium]